MRKFPLLLFVLFVFSSFSVYNKIELHEVIRPSVTSKIVPVPMDRIAKMKIIDVEKILGKKLSLKEKIALKFLQIKIKKQLKDKEKGKVSKGQNAMVLGILSLALLLIPFGILASIPLAIMAITIGSKARKENPHDGKAQAGIILGAVSLALIVIAILLVVVILSSGGYWL